jgi:hypothetical protein
MALNLDRYNTRVREWTKDSVNKMQAKALSYGVEHRSDSPSKGSSVRKLKDRYRQHDGSIDQVSIKFPRSLIWTNKGAGKGRAGIKGSKWTDKYGNTKSTNPKSMGKMGTLGRTTKPFFNDVLDSPSGVNELANIVAEETGDSIINEMFIK